MHQACNCRIVLFLRILIPLDTFDALVISSESETHISTLLGAGSLVAVFSSYFSHFSLIRICNS